MFELNKKRYLSLISITVFIFLYCTIVEFILPVNEIIPKPSLIIESIISLFKDYGILQSIALTSSVVYISLVLCYFLLHFTSHFIIKIADNKQINSIFSFLKLFKYFPFIVGIVLFVFYYNTSIYGEFLFAFLFVIFNLFAKFANINDNFVNEYKIFIENNKLSQNKLINMKSKLIQPGLYSSFKKLHLTLWAVVIVYEFIALTGGLGTKYNILLSNHDFSGFIALAILISILIWFGNYLFTLIKNKLIFWEH